MVTETGFCEAMGASELRSRSLVEGIGVDVHAKCLGYPGALATDATVSEDAPEE